MFALLFQGCQVHILIDNKTFLTLQNKLAPQASPICRSQVKFTNGRRYTWRLESGLPAEHREPASRLYELFFLDNHEWMVNRNLWTFFSQSDDDTREHRSPTLNSDSGAIKLWLRMPLEKCGTFCWSTSSPNYYYGCWSISRRGCLGYSHCTLPWFPFLLWIAMVP